MTTTYLTQASELTINQLKGLAQVWGVIPQGDKRKKQTWIDAIDQKRQEMSAEQASETQEAQYFVPSIDEDGEEFKLSDYSHLYGTTQYQLIQKIAVAQTCEHINFYRDFYARAVNLGMVDRDPGLDGDTIVA